MATTNNVVAVKAQARSAKFEEQIRLLQTSPVLWKQYMKLQEMVKENENSRMAGKTFARLLVQSVTVDKKMKLEQRLSRIEENRQKVMAELNALK